MDKNLKSNNYTFSVAPMMGVTTASARYMYRLISSHATLFTEMIASQAIYRGDYEKFLKKDKSQKVLIGSSESMSKSKKNTIDPEQMIKNYGADAVRLFILSDSPPEKDVQWSEEGMISSYKFLQKFWNMHTEIKKIIEDKKTGTELNNQCLIKFTNQVIKKIDKNLNNFQYNVIVANFHETYNFLSKKISQQSCVSKML